MKRVVAFAEASSTIGSGHLVRTSQLLSCLDTKKFEIEFYCNYEQMPEWLNKIKHKKIDSDTFFKLDLEDYDLLIFDSYKNREKLESIDKNVLLLDDYSFMDSKYIPNIILDYNYQTSEKFYKNQKLLLDTKYFPIGKDTFPEFLGKPSWNKNSKKILISLGGVSDQNLLDIDYFLDLGLKFGEVYLMDPLSRLDKYKNNNIKLVQNKSLSYILNEKEFKLGIVAGGTSKYIAASYSLPCLLVPRNKLEGILIEKFIENNLSFTESLLTDNFDDNYLISTLSKISNNLKKLIDVDNVNRLNKALLDL